MVRNAEERINKIVKKLLQLGGTNRPSDQVYPSQWEQGKLSTGGEAQKGNVE